MGESYAYSMRSSIEGDLKDKLDAADKEAINTKISKVINWLEDNGSAEKDEFEEKRKELEGVCNPIMTKMYQGAGGMPGGMPEGFPGADAGDAGDASATQGGGSLLSYT